jgi:RNA polymerase sigma factor (sigma-70 family)
MNINLQSFKDGNHDEFKLVFHIMEPEIRGWAMRRYYEAGVMDIEDAIAEAFCGLYIKREKIMSIEHMRKFLYIKVKYALIDKWKTSCKTIPLLPDLDFYEDEEGLSAGQISWLIAEQEKMLEEPLIDALKRIMYEFIDTLPKKQRRVIELTALGCGGHKIAEILGINYQTAINSRNRAIKSMYQTLPETSRHRLKIGIK